MKSPIFRGSAVALITPFNDSGIDFQTLDKLLDFHLENKTDAIVVCGTTGEAPTLSEDEQKEIISFAIKKINKKIPVIAGTSSNNTEHAVKLSKNAYELGVDAILVTPPYYNKTSQKGLFLHIERISKSAKCPIILYNIPSRTGGLGFDIKTLKNLSEIPNVVAVKESTSDMNIVAKIRSQTDLIVYSGNDDVIVPVMSLGGLGVISVIANILPRKTHEICEDFLKGNIEKSREEFIKMFDLIKLLFVEVNPIPIKSAMKVMKLDSGILRMPLVEIGENNLEKLKKAMSDYGII